MTQKSFSLQHNLQTTLRVSFIKASVTLQKAQGDAGLEILKMEPYMILEKTQFYIKSYKNSYLECLLPKSRFCIFSPSVSIACILKFLSMKYSYS